MIGLNKENVLGFNPFCKAPQALGEVFINAHTYDDGHRRKRLRWILLVTREKSICIASGLCATSRTKFSP